MRFIFGHSGRRFRPEELEFRHKRYNRIYYKNNRKIILDRSKKYYQDNMEQRKKYFQDNKAAISANYLVNSQKPRYRFKNYKSGATNRRLRFEITFEQFMSFWQKPCSYCGSGIETIGLDRMDAENGYVLSNIVPCCALCNTSKMKWDESDFIKHCLRVVEFSENNRGYNENKRVNQSTCRSVCRCAGTTESCKEGQGKSIL